MLARRADVVDLGAVHADHVKKGLAVDVEAGAGAALALHSGGQRSGRGDGRAVGGNNGRLQISLAGHDRGEGGGEVASADGIVGQAIGHQQSAEVGVAQA
jgi:hypothetical protein